MKNPWVWAATLPRPWNAVAGIGLGLGAGIVTWLLLQLVPDPYFNAVFTLLMVGILGCSVWLLLDLARPPRRRP